MERVLGDSNSSNGDTKPCGNLLLMPSKVNNNLPSLNDPSDIPISNLPASCIYSATHYTRFKRKCCLPTKILLSQHPILCSPKPIQCYPNPNRRHNSQAIRTPIRLQPINHTSLYPPRYLRTNNVPSAKAKPSSSTSTSARPPQQAMPFFYSKNWGGKHFGGGVIVDKHGARRAPWRFRIGKFNCFR